MVIIAIALLSYKIIQDQQNQSEKIIYSDFLNKVQKNIVAEVKIVGTSVKGYSIEGTYKGQVESGLQAEQTFTTFAPIDQNLIPLLRDHNVRIEVEKQSDNSLLTILATWVLPLALFIGIWIFFMRQMQGGSNRALSFGKSRAKMTTDQDKKVTFADVAGVEEAKEELREIIEFLKDPSRFSKLGGKIPKGVLLVGPPGTGKTLLARAIAGEASVPFFSISGSDFVELFVGVGASRVRDLFEKGKKNAPCIIFMDELDAVGRHRGAGLGGGHDEREQTLNALLVEMDGFESKEGVILIAATNRPDVLDPALLRPGRFDRQIVVDRPDVKGREEILRVHLRNIPKAEDVDLVVLARGTPGFCGADLANMVNEAALWAARQNKDKVDMADLEYAKDKVMMGPEKRSRVITDKEKKLIAYHEAGHALVAKFLPNAEEIHKATIIPRGMALGLTQFLPREDKYTYPKNYLEDNLASMLGGKVAEELVFGKEWTTNGSANDLERATQIARKMVCEWGMSDELGPVVFGKKEEHIFLGKELGEKEDHSEATAVIIDNEIKKIVYNAYDTAKKVLGENIDALHELAKQLLENETLSGEQIDQIAKEFGVSNVPKRAHEPPEPPRQPDVRDEA